MNERVTLTSVSRWPFRLVYRRHKDLSLSQQRHQRRFLFLLCQHFVCKTSQGLLSRRVTKNSIGMKGKYNNFICCICCQRWYYFSYNKLFLLLIIIIVVSNTDTHKECLKNYELNNLVYKQSCALDSTSARGEIWWAWLPQRIKCVMFRCHHFHKDHHSWSSLCRCNSMSLFAPLQSSFVTHPPSSGNIKNSFELLHLS